MHGSSVLQSWACRHDHGLEHASQPCLCPVYNPNYLDTRTLTLVLLTPRPNYSMLHAKNPEVATNLVCYSYGEGLHKKIPAGSDAHLVIHYATDGTMLYHESDEAGAQLAREKQLRDKHASWVRDIERRAAEEGKSVEEVQEMEATGGKNQFNYSERAAQTYSVNTRSRAVSTTLPATASFSTTFSQWQLYDTFVSKWHQAVADSEDDGTHREPPKQPVLSAPAGLKGQELVQGSDAARVLKVLERMVTQNAQDEIYNDFKFWEDASDEHRGHLGTLLPLWRFMDSRVKKKQATALAWNPLYADLFAVAFGSYDFMKQGNGHVAIYSLKNVSHPEAFYTLESGVMSLDFHPTKPALLAAGCYDGTVKVFDMRRKDMTPLYVSDMRSGKHNDPVWQVKWQTGGLGSELCFFSVSSDGKIASWNLCKNELKMEPVMLLKLVAPPSEDAVDMVAGGVSVEGSGAVGSTADLGATGGVGEDTSLTGLAGGSCFDFNPHDPHLFLVGTEEGGLHLASKAYSGQYLATYQGHTMAVYAVKWNPFHPKLFLTASADWTVKVWHTDAPAPVFSYDLSHAVGDVAWAPYSSTVFSAVAAHGKAFVFDLSVDKHEPLCEQKVAKKARLTHVSFSHKDPVLLVGDSMGAVNSMKLSPNLRKVTQIKVPDVKKGETPPPPRTRIDVEIEKVENLLARADVRTKPLAEDVLANLIAKERQATDQAGPGAAAAKA